MSVEIVRKITFEFEVELKAKTEYEIRAKEGKIRVCLLNLQKRLEHAGTIEKKEVLND
jgi:hypothetical protein